MAGFNFLLASLLIFVLMCPRVVSLCARRCRCAVLPFVLLPPSSQYPAYIREHESSLSAADLSNYRKQQSCFERIVHVFDTQPQASMQIMELMNEMQQYGTPPKELVSDFMPPGFDANAPMPPGMGPSQGGCMRLREAEQDVGCMCQSLSFAH